MGGGPVLQHDSDIQEGSVGGGDVDRWGDSSQRKVVSSGVGVNAGPVGDRSLYVGCEGVNGGSMIAQYSSPMHHIANNGSVPVRTNAILGRSCGLEMTSYDTCTTEHSPPLGSWSVPNNGGPYRDPVNLYNQPDSHNSLVDSYCPPTTRPVTTHRPPVGDTTGEDSNRGQSSSTPPHPVLSMYNGVGGGIEESNRCPITPAHSSIRPSVPQVSFYPWMSVVGTSIFKCYIQFEIVV